LNNVITFVVQLGILCILSGLFNLLGFAKLKYKEFALFLLLIVIYFIGLTFLAQFIRETFHIHSGWNWVGKAIAVSLWALAAFSLVRVSKRCNWKEMGFTLHQNQGSILPSFIALFVLIMAFHTGGSFSFENVKFETLLFQATMPGLDEESGFRGVLLFVLSIAVVSKEIKLLGAPLNVSSLLITIYFAVGHACSYANGSLNFQSSTFFSVLLIGFFLVWVRLRTGSIVLPILFHNAFNVINQFSSQNP
jgi:membrane protease YdiL (CAAX protease family)